MLRWFKTLFWGILAPLAILVQGGLFAYTISVLVLTFIYVDWLKRIDITATILTIQAVIVVLFILVTSGVLLLGSALALIA